MANVFRQATSWLYTGLAVAILGAWSLILLILLAGTAISEDPGLIQLIALPSLLTFLVAKLIVVASAPVTPPSRGGNGNLAMWLATADNGSPQGALVLFLLSVTWLLHLARLVFMLFLATLFGFFVVFLATTNNTSEEEGIKNDVGSHDEARQNFTTAVAEFEEKMGWSFSESLQDNPWAMVQAFAIIWGILSLLMAYIVAYGFGAIRKVLTTPLEAWSRGTEAPATIEGAQKDTATTVVVEKEKVVLRAGTETTTT